MIVTIFIKNHYYYYWFYYSQFSAAVHKFIVFNPGKNKTTYFSLFQRMDNTRGDRNSFCFCFVFFKVIARHSLMHSKQQRKTAWFL